MCACLYGFALLQLLHVWSFFFVVIGTCGVGWASGPRSWRWNNIGGYCGCRVTEGNLFLLSDTCLRFSTSSYGLVAVSLICEVLRLGYLWSDHNLYREQMIWWGIRFTRHLLSVDTEWVPLFFQFFCPFFTDYCTCAYYFHVDSLQWGKLANMLKKN